MRKSLEDPEKKQSDEGEEDGRSASGELFGWLQTIISAMVFCVLIFVFLFRTVGVVGPSMEQTLHQGDRLIISGLFYTPKYGDIVVLRKDTFKNDPIIKRVIATEGQTIDIDFDRGVVYVDGISLEEPYINALTTLREDFQGPVTVPDGCVFVMGDNRNRSTDSRTSSIGCVDVRYIIGRVILRLAPFNQFGRVS